MSAVRETFHVWYSYKSGLGIELARVAPALRRLEARYDVHLKSFHSYIYRGDFRPDALIECSPPVIKVPEGQRGLCFTCEERADGPFRWPQLESEARRLGWRCVDEALAMPGSGTYGAAELLARSMSSNYSVRRCVLRSVSRRSGAFVLNLFGGAAPQKGFSTAGGIRSIIRGIGARNTSLDWVVPALPHQRLADTVEQARVPNVRLARFDDPRLTELFGTAPVVVTVEGGGLHVAVEYGVPTLLLSSPTWFAEVQGVLPPDNSFDLVLGNMAIDTTDDIVQRANDWVALTMTMS
jgi:hypothetical protein